METGFQGLPLAASILERIDSGKYDVCAECGEKIGASRLSALPYTRVCIECA